MKKHQPYYYIEIRHEKIDKYPFPHPIEYCNGKRYCEYEENSFERLNWGKLKSESIWFNQCLEICRYKHSIWANKKAMDSAFEHVFNNPTKGDGVYVPMKDFEIYLMNKGYKMMSFDKMCSQSPCVYIKCDSVDGNKITNPQRVEYTRYYTCKETNKSIMFCFGIENEHLKFNFYFVHSDIPNRQFQTPTNPNYFEKAEKLQLKSFQDIYMELKRSKND